MGRYLASVVYVVAIAALMAAALYCVQVNPIERYGADERPPPRSAAKRLDDLRQYVRKLFAM